MLELQLEELNQELEKVNKSIDKRFNNIKGSLDKLEKFFQRLQKLEEICKEYVDTVEAGEFVDEDLVHYVFEAAIVAFYGENVWKERLNSKLQEL
jgi:DNA repair ATPase RecN